MYYTTKELNDFVNSFNQKSGEYVWGWILKVWDNGEENIKLDQAEYIDMDHLSGDSWLNMEAITVFFFLKKKVSKGCLKCQLKCLFKDVLLKGSWKCL